MKKIVLIVFMTFLFATPVSALKVNDAAPAFSLPDSTGKEFSLADIAGEGGKNGKGVVLSFFASWCVPCRDELPLINSFVDELRREGLTVILVNVKENFKTIQTLLAELKVDKPVVVSDRDGKTADMFGVRFLPTTFFIGADGKVRDVVYGGIKDGRELQEHVQKLLQK